MRPATRSSHSGSLPLVSPLPPSSRTPLPLSSTSGSQYTLPSATVKPAIDGKEAKTDISPAAGAAIDDIKVVVLSSTPLQSSPPDPGAVPDTDRAQAPRAHHIPPPHPLASRFICTGDSRCLPRLEQGRCGNCRPCRLFKLFEELEPGAVNVDTEVRRWMPRENDLSFKRIELCPGREVPVWLRSLWLFAASERDFKDCKIGEKGNGYGESTLAHDSVLLLPAHRLVLKRIDKPSQCTSKELPPRHAEYLQLQHLFAEQGLAPAVYGYLLVRKPWSTETVFWLVMDLVLLGDGFSLDLGQAQSLKLRPAAAAFRDFLRQTLDFSSDVVPLLMADLKPANIAPAASAEQGFLMLDPDPRHCMWLWSQPQQTVQYRETIQLSNLLSFVANSTGRLGEGLWPVVWELLRPLLAPETGEDGPPGAFERCVEWWSQGLKDPEQRSAHTQFANARHYLKGMQVHQRLLERMPPLAASGVALAWVDKDKGYEWWWNTVTKDGIGAAVGKCINLQDMTQAPTTRAWDAYSVPENTTDEHVSQFLRVLIRIAAWCGRPRRSARSH